MNVYFNRLVSKNTSIDMVAAYLMKHFKLQGVECTMDKTDNWDVCLAFMKELDNTVFEQGPVVQRLDSIYIDSDTDYRKDNFDIQNTYSKATGIIFQSDFSRKVAVHNFGKYPDKWKVIYNGTEIDDKSDSLFILGNFCPEWKKKLDRFPVRLVCAAQWRWGKRLDSIAAGAAIYTKANPEACLFVLGDVDSSTQDHLIAFGGNIVFVGRVDNTAVRHFYKIANVCLNLSIMDSCPNSVIEAMAHGTPCLVTKHQGVVKLMKENSGYVLDVDPWNYGPVSFKKMAKLIDPNVVADGIDRCVKIGRQPYRYDLSMEKMAQKYIEFLKKVAKNGRYTFEM